MGEQTVAHRGPISEMIGAIVTVVLTILGLAKVAPTFLVAVATIAFGATLLLQAAATIAEYIRLEDSTLSSDATVLSGSGSLSALLLAGAGGVVLGILALLGIETVELTAIAVIAFGGALILGSNLGARSRLIRHAAGGMDNAAKSLVADIWAGELLSSSAGILTLTGLAAIVLGILALSGFSPLNLVLIALLALGSVSVVSRVDLTDVVLGALRRA